MNTSLFFRRFFSRVVDKVQKVPVAFWIVLMVTIPVGSIAFGLLLLSETQDNECQSARRSPTLPDSTRLYCAQLIAHRQTPEALVEAIQLADAVALNHPLRKDGDRLIHQWSNRLVELSENAFQSGDLDQALEFVEGIPKETALYTQAATRTRQWKTIWDEGEAIFEAAQTALEDDELAMAFAEARKLLRVDNQYWSTTRFQELVNQIQATKESQTEVAKSRKPKKGTTILPASFSPSSTEELLSEWQKEQEVDARRHLAKAEDLALGGNLDGLKAAISEAELVFSGTSRYAQAQQLMLDWNRQIETIEDQPYLERAIKLAQKGDLTSLQAAISEANNIYFGRALYQEAQGKIDEWTQRSRELHAQQYSQKPMSPDRSPMQETDDLMPPTPISP